MSRLYENRVTVVMKELVLSIIASLAFSGLLTGALVFLTKSWISQRLKSAIEHEYAEKLEDYKARLKTEHDLALERLKASNAQNQAVQAAATASFTATHIMAQKRDCRLSRRFGKRQCSYVPDFRRLCRCLIF
jgi:hypothetical protein